MAEESLKGKLLVATPKLGDPNFFGTVVLLLEHSEQGALGVVLNRPSEVTVGATLARWEGVVSAPGVVFIGGPVSRESAMALAPLEGASLEGASLEEATGEGAAGAGVEDEEEDEGWRMVVGSVAIVDLRGIRARLGRRGWGCGCGGCGCSAGTRSGAGGSWRRS